MCAEEGRLTIPACVRSRRGQVGLLPRSCRLRSGPSPDKSSLRRVSLRSDARPASSPRPLFSFSDLRFPNSHHHPPWPRGRLPVIRAGPPSLRATTHGPSAPAATPAAALSTAHTAPPPSSAAASRHGRRSRRSMSLSCLVPHRVCPPQGSPMITNADVPWLTASATHRRTQIGRAHV